MSDYELQAEEAIAAFSGNSLRGGSAAFTGEKTQQSLEDSGPRRHWDLPICLHFKAEDLISPHSAPRDAGTDPWVNFPIKSICEFSGICLYVSPAMLLGNNT